MSLPRDTERDPHADALLIAALNAADGVEAGDCPDAEVIGLYAERALAGAELHAVEAHVHTCPRCQATVAAFVRALPEEPAVDAGRAVAGVHGASTGGGFAAWFAGWRWLVPTASLAAVALVAVWVGRGPADQMAESARGPAVAVETDGAAPAAQSTVASRSDAFVPRDETSGLVATAPMADARDKSAPPAEARRKAMGAPNERAAVANQAPAGAMVVGATREEALAVAPAAAPVQETLTVTQAPAVPAAQAVPAAPAIGTPAPLQAPSAAGGAAPARAEASAEQRARPAEILGANDSSTFRVPPAASFRLRAGAVERSLDRGTTWQRAMLPAGVTVLAIAAPAPNVCWAIAADAVLRATDGVTFTREPVPTTERLTGITATDAMRAVVTAASGARFATANGGRTWSPAP